MSRPKREASKVHDYCAYHLSGDLTDKLQGRVAALVTSIESPVKTAPRSEDTVDLDTMADRGSELNPQPSTSHTTYPRGSYHTSGSVGHKDASAPLTRKLIKLTIMSARNEVCTTQ